MRSKTILLFSSLVLSVGSLPMAGQTTTLFDFETGLSGFAAVTENNGGVVVSFDSTGTGATSGTGSMRIERSAGTWYWAAGSPLSADARAAIGAASVSSTPMSLYGDVTVVPGTATTGWIQMGLVLQYNTGWGQTGNLIDTGLPMSGPVTFEQPIPYGDAITWGADTAGWGNIQFFLNFDAANTGTLTVYIDNIRIAPASSAQVSYWNGVAATPGGWRYTGVDGEAGIGWIWDAHWPYVFSWGFGNGDWLWVHQGAGSSRDAFYAYNFDGTYWAYVVPSIGYYYNFETPGWVQIGQ